MTEKDVVGSKKQALIDLVSGFCDQKLDAEYKDLSIRLINKMARKRTIPFISGKIEIWAAAVIYALGQNNFLFDKSFEPYVSTGEICSFFNTSQSTTSQKAKIIRDMFKMNLFFGDQEFLTSRMFKGNPLNNLINMNGFIVNKESVPDGGDEPQELSFTEPSSKPFSNVFQLKIELLDTNVWRRILVPEYYTFYDLHVAIQYAMGWYDSHLHQFLVKDGDGQELSFETPAGAEDYFDEPDGYTTEVPIAQYLKNEKDKVNYIYDFGDNWEHKITLEKILDKDPEQKYPVCIDGAMACPPEDCGSTGGYKNCIDAVTKNDNSDGLLDWLHGWEPNKFSPKDVVFESPKEHFLMTMEI